MSCLSDSVFHQFPSLPVEIRLMVWEYTWPMPRVIEAVSFEVFDDDDYEEFTILRPVGSISKFLNHRFEWRILESKPLESCPHPVALGVCHESRQHTLKHFLAMEHSKSDAGSFFFRPLHDLLWFSLDFTDEKERLQDLVHFYGDQLLCFQVVLVCEDDWITDTPYGYMSNYLSPMGPLEEIHIVYDELDGDGELVEPKAEDLSVHAQELKDEYADLIGNIHDGNVKAKHIRCLDRSGKYY